MTRRRRQRRARSGGSLESSWRREPFARWHLSSQSSSGSTASQWGRTWCTPPQSQHSGWVWIQHRGCTYNTVGHTYTVGVYCITWWVCKQHSSTAIGLGGWAYMTVECQVTRCTKPSN